MWGPEESEFRTEPSEARIVMQSRCMRTVVRPLLAVLMAGSLFGFSCSGAGEKLIKNVNPCGTILNCDPLEYDLITMEFPDWEVDPSCTMPGLCTPVAFPVGDVGTNQGQQP